ncbi:hypothetical protein [[Phormidium] sp. ETS-05]|uniref:hypothetical protein n=1 Tax=[Phormidium] sp. ETS-05 TaxID=222819 RepID=UPI0018EEE4CF|nr:hypothetical protein [[Phormidium] sp. ETS-05]
MPSITQLEELFVSASVSQTISKDEWETLSGLSEAPLSIEAQRMIKRIMHGVRRGWVNIVD